MLGLKYFKRIWKVEGFLLCCGIPLERATRYVGITDVIFGILFFAAIFLHLNEVNDHVPEDEQTLGFMMTFLPHWLSLLVLSSHVVKFFLGIVVYIGAVVRCRAICRLWLLVSSIGSLFAFPTNIFHLYEIMIVNRFCKELRDDSRKTPLHRRQEKRSKFSRGHAIFPAPMDLEDYLPTGENNNVVDGKYIRFGNTTYSEQQDNSDMHSGNRPTALHPPQRMQTNSLKISTRLLHSVRRPSSSSADVYLVKENGDSNEEDRDDFSKSGTNCLRETLTSSRFYGLVQTIPPTPIPQRMRLKSNAMVIPMVIITPAENEISPGTDHM